MSNNEFPENKTINTNEEKEIEIFEPILGEIVSDDSFSFTLLSCHCSMIC